MIMDEIARKYVNSKDNGKRRYNIKLLKALWWTTFANFMIFPFFVFFGDMFPDQVWLQIRSIIIGGVDVSYIIAVLYIIAGIVVVTWKPQTRNRILVMASAGAVATVLFSVLTMNANVIVNSFTWFILMFSAQVLFGWQLFIVCAISMLAAGIYKSSFFYNAQDFSTSLPYAFLSSATVTAYAGLMSILRNAGTIKIEVYEQLKTREEIQAANVTTIINSINDAILNISTRGKILMYNATTLGLLDTNANLIGNNVDELLKLTDDNGDAVKLSRLASGITTTTEYTNFMHTYPDGQKINLYIALAPVRRAYGENQNPKNNPSVNGLIIIMRDITKQKTIDDEKDEFISVVSHELRTPVAITEGALSNLQFVVEKGSDPKILIKSLEDAHQQVMILATMLNDLSTLSRAQRGVNIETEDIDVGGFIEKLQQKYLPDAKKHKLTLSIDIGIDGVVNVSRMLIEEIMQNLINNAIKYTNRGGFTIGVRPVDNNAKQVEFYVKDTGVGISQSDQKHLFKKFWRSEDFRTRENGGTGLGLYIVAQLADKIGTKINTVSRPGYGSTFSFQLPLTPVSEESRVKTNDEPKSRK